MGGRVDQHPGPGENVKNELYLLTWTDPLIVEWHVLLVYNQPTNTLLPMSAGEFIPQFGPPRLPYENLNQSLVVICVRYHDFVDVSRDGRLVCHW